MVQYLHFRILKFPLTKGRLVLAGCHPFKAGIIIPETLEKKNLAVGILTYSNIEFLEVASFTI